MAFDEPTSGLDSSTSNQILLLLKHLAQQGHTILCSIHQPPPSAFDLFDHLYMMANGKCIYAGTSGMLIPFLAEFELICPKTYDPFDFCKNLSKTSLILYKNRFKSFLIMEIVHYSYGGSDRQLWTA